MNYEQFICAMIECTNRQLPENTWAERQDILKNNGVKAVGLAIRKKEVKVAPLIYLEEFYTKYLMGSSVEELAEYLIRYSEKAPNAPEWDYHRIFEFDKIKGQIVYKLVDAKKNEKLLQEIPHLPVLDFAIVFYLMIPTEIYEGCSVLIRNTHMDLWKLPISILYEHARRNTPRLCPHVFCPVEELVDEAQQGMCPLYVLTNEQGIFGAASILYPGMTDKIYETVGENYYLVPSSVHEFLIVPDTPQLNAGNLEGMLREINETHVQQEEVLSDHIYYFNGHIITKM